MVGLKNRIEALVKVTNRWLEDENDYLNDAIDRTVREGYFTLQEVNYALEAIKKSVNAEALNNWIDRIEINDDHDAEGQHVVCLHAGNIPLVGFQDAFCTLLSGARYNGKISKKDPYLLPTFLNEVKKTSVWTDRDVQWTHRLDDFEGMQHDAILFAGSDSSVPDVKKAIQNLNLSSDHTRYLIRTAHFSMAFLDKKDPQSLKNLAEAMLQYDCKGCRSVAVVVSPFSLDEIGNKLKNEIKSFWQSTPLQRDTYQKLKQQYAYNMAIERAQLWLNYFLIQQADSEPGQEFVCNWIQGDEEKAAQLAQSFSDKVQSIFVTDHKVKIPGDHKAELLAYAQKPAIDWTPDGIDTLQWLCRAEDV